MDPPPLQPGHRLDRYELLCPLAYGGMASVWLARFGGSRGFERLVVVKMILPQFAGDPRFQEMFVDEARIASRIEHPNVARILDVGEQDENTTYIVMEWVDGDSLSKIDRAAEVKKQRVPPGIAMRICADAAAGLHAAHILEERDGTVLGVVHRDVSPQNILVSNAGTTVLIDFGVAKARDRVSEDTSAGQLKGKIRYMAPEQALGKTLDHRADIWSLGAILYELLSGVSPYDAPNEVTTLHKLTSGKAPPPLPESVAEPIRDVVERALAYEAEARYPTMLDFRVALESAMHEIGEATSPADVASYTADLLVERKAARKQAVAAALAAAHAREAARATPTPASEAEAPSPGQPRGPFAAPTPTPRYPVPPAVDRFPPSSALLTPAPRYPSASGAPPSSGPMGYGEMPSAASSSSLGSTSLEYAAAPREDRATRARRMVIASALGVSLAAGLVGVVLVVSTAMAKHEARATRAPAAPPEAPAPSAESSAAPRGSAASAASATPLASAGAAPGSTSAPRAPAATAGGRRPLAVPAPRTKSAASPEKPEKPEKSEKPL